MPIVKENIKKVPSYSIGTLRAPTPIRMREYSLFLSNSRLHILSSLNIICFSINTQVSVKTLWITSLEFIDIHLKYSFQVITNGVRTHGKIPCDIAKFFSKAFFVEFMTLE